MIRTLRAERHMERVECVTDQVRWSHSGGGDAVEDVEDDEYFEGERKIMADGMLILFGFARSCVFLPSVEITRLKVAR